ncbi:MAG TPA: sulfatase [Gaiellales bacterium]|jgi:arylsulfatase A-like enzyme
MTESNSTRRRRPRRSLRAPAAVAVVILAGLAFGGGYAIGHRSGGSPSTSIAGVAGTGPTATTTVVHGGSTIVSIGGGTTEPPPKGAGTASVATTKRPNIVVILTDDQRFDTLWAMPQVQSLLVDHGITFKNAFVTNSFCCPSRATILTGNFSHTTGIYGNAPPHGGAPDFRKYGDDRSTIATWLHGAGYDTGLFGKYLNDYGGPYIPPGWTHWDTFNYAFRYYGFQAYTNSQTQCSGRPSCKVDYGKNQYSTTVFGEAAAQFIRTAPAAKPLFVYYAPFAPHEPDVPATQYANRFQNLPLWRPPNYDRVNASQPDYIKNRAPLTKRQVRLLAQFRRRQYATLLSVDDEVGSIVDALRASHRLSNTMIVFASDNGLAWGAHRLPSAEKRIPYDEATRVPFVVRYDPMTPTPRTDSHLIVNIDWAPTFAALASVSHPHVEGRSFLPIVQGTTISPPWRTSFLLENWDGSPKTLAPTYCGIRSTRYLYVRYGTGEEELYDQLHDPFDLHNVARSPAYAGVLGRNRAEMLRDCRPPPPGYKLP